METWNIIGIDINKLKNYIPSHNDKKNVLNIQDKHNFTYLEKIVYKIASFNTQNKKGVCVEYYFSNNPEMTFEKNNPLVTSFTYLNNSECPTIFTCHDLEKYKYKDFPNKNCFISFPRELKHVCVNGSNFYGTLMTDTCDTATRLVVNIYDGMNFLLDEDNNKICEIQFIKNKIKEICIDNSIINYEFYEELYYIKQDTSLLLKILTSNDIFLNKISSHLDKCYDVLFSVYEFPLNKITFNELLKKYYSNI
jgi:hypothetical protein